MAIRPKIVTIIACVTAVLGANSLAETPFIYWFSTAHLTSLKNQFVDRTSVKGIPVSVAAGFAGA